MEDKKLTNDELINNKTNLVRKTFNDTNYNTDAYFKHLRMLDCKGHFFRVVAKQLGCIFSNDKNGRKEINRSLKSRYIDYNLPPKEFEDDRKNLGNWLAGRNTPAAKGLIYKLCFILNLTDDIESVQDFIGRAFWFQPFNCKDKEDVIFYYCIMNKLGYNDFVFLNNKYQKCNNANLHRSDIPSSQQLREKMSTLDSDVKLDDYIKNNCYSKEFQYMTARTRIMNILDDKKDQERIRGYFYSNFGKKI